MIRTGFFLVGFKAVLPRGKASPSHLQTASVSTSATLNSAQPQHRAT